MIEARDRIARAAYAAMRRVEADAALWAANETAMPEPAGVERALGEADRLDRELFERDGLVPATW
jgi:hypothetical protein